MKKLLLLALFLVVTVLLVACTTPAAEPTISISEDGYLVVNGTKTEHKVHTEPVISVIDGYVAVNGVKTQYVAVVCEHVWQTVTTPPTCLTNGYDTLTCELCGITSVENKTPALPHTFASTYTTDEYFHWFKCETCNAKKAKMLHSADENDVCTVCGGAASSTGTPGVIYDIPGDGTYAEVVGYEGTSTIVKIADTYQGLPVKSIYDRAFQFSDITSVIIGRNVTSIGNCAFENCFDLTSVMIPDSVTSIKNEAFRSCNSLVSIVIPDSVTSIESYAFYNCYSLTSVTLGNGITSMGGKAFDWCTALAFTTYGNCKYLGNATNPYLALIEPTNKNLSSYVIHENTKALADGAFSECTRLTSIEIPDGITEITGTFLGCTSLTSITIPDSVTTIGRSAFYECSSLKSITIPDSVTTIGDFAFDGCSSLESIVISDSVTTISDYAFSGCSKLSNVYYTGSEQQWQAIPGSSGYNLTRATKHYNYTPR